MKMHKKSTNRFDILSSLIYLLFICLTHYLTLLFSVYTFFALLSISRAKKTNDKRPLFFETNSFWMAQFKFLIDSKIPLLFVLKLMENDFSK
jgi:hypothetical protein